MPTSESNHAEDRATPRVVLPSRGENGRGGARGNTDAATRLASAYLPASALTPGCPLLQNHLHLLYKIEERREKKIAKQLPRSRPRVECLVVVVLLLLLFIWTPTRTLLPGLEDNVGAPGWLKQVSV